MKKFHSIDQFRQVVRTVRTRHDFKGVDEEGKAIYNHTSPYPTIKFHGTVKVHGTNAAIVKYVDGHIEFQSRERVLTRDQDNAGFMAHFESLDLTYLFQDIQFNEYAAIYGEWCGGSIQKGVGITGLPKMFIVFGLKVDDKWLPVNIVPIDALNRIYNIEQFKTWDIRIDFNNPELSQNEIIEETIKVEEECPIAAMFGVKGTGEGIVFTAEPDLIFKSKGEKHSVTKVKTLAAVNTEELESINEFVEYAVTENRLKQGLQYLQENGFELIAKSTGDFIRWVVTDITKEESDTISNNGLDIKAINNKIATKSRMWFLNNF